MIDLCKYFLVGVDIFICKDAIYTYISFIHDKRWRLDKKNLIINWIKYIIFNVEVAITVRWTIDIQRTHIRGSRVRGLI